MTYTKLSLREVEAQMVRVARDARSAFGALDEQQLNWQPDVRQWSVAQCLDHLVRANDLMLASARTGIGRGSRSFWQRISPLPRLLGWMLIRSQSPNMKGKFTAPVSARPTSSQIRTDIIERFVAQHAEAAEWTRGLDEGVASRAIMVSPFIKVVTYSVLDGLRLLVAHDRRHFEQALRVMQSAGFQRTD